MKQSFDLASYVFITFCGCRPAEPCSLSVAATHQLLTNVLLYLMYSMRYYHGDKYPDVCDSHFDIEEVRELEMMNRDTLTVLRQICGAGSRSSAMAPRRAEARRGCHCTASCSRAYWASHILEGPIRGSSRPRTSPSPSRGVHSAFPLVKGIVGGAAGWGVSYGSWTPAPALQILAV